MKSLILCAAILALISAENNILKQRGSNIKDRLKSLIDNKNDTEPLNTCGGNCPSNDCNSCPCGETKKDVSVSTWCGKYSGWNQKNCECIMSHESGGNENAANENTNGSFDIGLWQINSMNWDSCSSGKAPCDPDTNLACAKKVYEWGGNTWKLWSTCTVK